MTASEFSLTAALKTPDADNRLRLLKAFCSECEDEGPDGVPAVTATVCKLLSENIRAGFELANEEDVAVCHERWRPELVAYIRTAGALLSAQAANDNSTKMLKMKVFSCIADGLAQVEERYHEEQRADEKDLLHVSWLAFVDEAAQLFAHINSPAKLEGSYSLLCLMVSLWNVEVDTTPDVSLAAALHGSCS